MAVVHVPAPLHQRIKTLAVQRGMKLQKLVAQLLQEALAK